MWGGGGCCGWGGGLGVFLCVFCVVVCGGFCLLFCCVCVGWGCCCWCVVVCVGGCFGCVGLFVCGGVFALLFLVWWLCGVVVLLVWIVGLVGAVFVVGFVGSLFVAQKAWDQGESYC
ncbi:hypothetical protein, partial [Pseudomonas syringae group genomosp. 7]|uniref:hypothetical protein n=1 Tax=Pseudomonas syringae group genomosp. 7 TaxID=251699 RepID=UPI00376F747C